MVGGHQRGFPRGSGSWRSLRAHCGSQGCDRPHGQDLLSLLVEAEAAHIFQNFKVAFLHLYPLEPLLYLPGLTPVCSQQPSKRSERHASCQGSNTSRCFLFLSERVTWQKSQPHQTSSWKWQLFPWSHWDFGSPHTPGYPIIPFSTASCTATVLCSSNNGSADRNWNLTQPSWWMGWHCTSLPQGTLIRVQV